VPQHPIAYIPNTLGVALPCGAASAPLVASNTITVAKPTAPLAAPFLDAQICQVAPQSVHPQHITGNMVTALDMQAFSVQHRSAACMITLMLPPVCEEMSVLPSRTLVSKSTCVVTAPKPLSRKVSGLPLEVQPIFGTIIPVMHVFAGQQLNPWSISAEVLEAVVPIAWVSVIGPWDNLEPIYQRIAINIVWNLLFH
jgi:hypothetical protein